MTVIRVKGFKIFKAKGRPYCYHRATGHKVDLAKAPLGSAAFFAECARISALAEATVARAPRAGTLGGLIAHYLATDHFRDLAPRTRSDYRAAATYLDPLSDVPVIALTTPIMAGIYDKATAKRGWRQGLMVLTFLRQVFKFARPHGLIERDPTEGVIQKARPKAAGYANRPWTVLELATFLDASPAPLRAALALMSNTGLDPSDAIRMTRRDAGEGVLRGLRGKTGQEIVVPIGTRLAAALDAAPAHDAVTVLASGRGKPWTYDGLATAFQRLKADLRTKDAIGAGLTMKGLRHTVATTLREAGVDERSIADLLGQKTTSMAGHYSRSADLTSKNRATVARLDDANERRTDPVKPFPKSVKPKGHTQ